MPTNCLPRKENRRERQTETSITKPDMNFFAVRGMLFAFLQSSFVFVGWEHSRAHTLHRNCKHNMRFTPNFSVVPPVTGPLPPGKDSRPSDV